MALDKDGINPHTHAIHRRSGEIIARYNTFVDRLADGEAIDLDEARLLAGSLRSSCLDITSSKALDMSVWSSDQEVRRAHIEHLIAQHDPDSEPPSDGAPSTERLAEARANAQSNGAYGLSPDGRSATAPVIIPPRRTPGEIQKIKVRSWLHAMRYLVVPGTLLLAVLVLTILQNS